MKIHPSEFRLGNIAFDPMHYGGGRNVSIDSIGVTSETKQWWDSLDPIPLSNELLSLLEIKKEKVGSIGGQDQWSGMGAYSYKGEWLFRGGPKNLHLVGYFNTQVNALHQLQNLMFAIKRVELQIPSIIMSTTWQHS